MNSRDEWGELANNEVDRQTRYVLLARLPREVEVRIEDAYLSPAGATRPLMGYHISLLGPFHLLAGVDSLTLECVGSVCRKTPPITVRVAGLDVFRADNNNVVYLQIAEPERLAALHAELILATRQMIVLQQDRCNEGQEIEECYTPHVTLGLGLSNEQLELFLHTAEERQLDATFDVTGLWMARETATSPWQYIAEYPLGATSGAPLG